MVEHHESEAPLSVSVVIPTFNRRDQLHGTIESLRTQTYAGSLEIVVVSDGSTDGTAEYLDGLAIPELTVRHQDNAGPSAARNTGIRAATNDLIVFLDDDIVARPGLIEAHARLHAEVGPGVAVIGPMLTPDDADLSPWVDWEQAMLEKQYAELAVDPEASRHQFYTGNASVRREELLAVGGFDEGLRRAEDVDLAFRLAQAGVRFRFCPEAEAVHYAERSFESWSAIATEYGRLAVSRGLAGQDPALRHLADRHAVRRPLQRRAIRTVLRRPAAFVPVLRRGRALASRLGWERMARMLLGLDWSVAYYRGAAHELGSIDRLHEILRAGGTEADRLSVIFVIEQALGHVTHRRNLLSALRPAPGLWFLDAPVAFESTSRLARLPLLSNWTLRAGLGARRELRNIRRRYPDLEPNALFVHTQVPAQLLGRWMTRVPTVVSLDATPRQYDALGAAYDHTVGPAPVEQLKLRLNRWCFQRAIHLVTWSEWARRGLVDDYGVDPDHITVIPPGVDRTLWARPAAASRFEGPVGVLFVGGDFDRKGGPLLLEAAARLRADPSTPPFELHLVTRSDVDPDDGVVVHRDLNANTPELIDLYHRCEIFCLPSLGDCLPMVLGEAGAAGLALVATDVGAIGEIVRTGETGHLVRPGSVDDLEHALRALLEDPAQRRRLGDSAADLIEREHDAVRNARRLVELIARAVGHRLPPDWAGSTGAGRVG